MAAARRADSKPFRRAAVPEGVCPDCVMTEFLYNTYPINWQIDQVGPELLLKPDFAEAAFVCSGLMDGCEMQIQEVNWQRVVENWKLPVQVRYFPAMKSRAILIRMLQRIIEQKGGTIVCRRKQ